MNPRLISQSESDAVAAINSKFAFLKAVSDRDEEQVVVSEHMDGITLKMAFLTIQDAEVLARCDDGNIAIDYLTSRGAIRG